jgi:hypothetical protein
VNPWIITNTANLGYWNSQSLQALTSVAVEATDSPGFSRCQIVFDRTTPTGTREDVMSVGMAWAEVLLPACSPLSNSDKAVVETALNTWWTSYKANVSNQITLREYRWYDYEPIITRPGPVDRVTPRAQTGTAASQRPPDQLALTQTWKTASRKHWGRWYLPYPGSGNFDTTYGRVAAAIQTNVQGYTRTLLQVSGGTGLINPVVASIGYQGVMGIRELQTDDIADVIRSRRAKVPASRLTNTS